jgi:hypothetical protein
MNYEWQPTTHRPALEAVAELLLWAGYDRIADEIYAVIESDATEVGRQTEEWREAFEQG